MSSHAAAVDEPSYKVETFPSSEAVVDKSSYKVETFPSSEAVVDKSSYKTGSFPSSEAKLKPVKPLLHCILPSWLHLIYFLSASLFGFFLLATLPMRTNYHSYNPSPSHLDLLFMSISANTVSSMDTVELESFSPSQLTVLIVLMLLGGEIFISMLLLLITSLKKQSPTIKDEERGPTKLNSEEPESDWFLLQSSSKFLLRVVSSYFLLTHLLGYTVIKIYFAMYPTSRIVLDRKGIHEDMFIVFTVVSSFANCGFLPTNENMIVFKNFSGILITVGTLVLLGNTMYPVGLRLMLLALNKVSKTRELEFLLKDGNRKYLGYDSHLMGGEMEVGMLGVTVSAFITIQAILFICLEWKSEGLHGMNSYQKVIGSLFMSINSRHSGESIVDLSAVSSAILVVFVVMMYLPPYTTFLPTSWRGSGEGEKKKKRSISGLIAANATLSQLSYLAIFVIIICITERSHLSRDPLNFNALNIVIEVISAYGNVGYSTGYSCKRQLIQNEECRDIAVGFSGKWTKGGKVTLMLVMMYGRLKKFNNNGGRAWMLR